MVTALCLRCLIVDALCLALFGAVCWWSARQCARCGANAKGERE
jgi:hypothetical protein